MASSLTTTCSSCSMPVLSLQGSFEAGGGGGGAKAEGEAQAPLLTSVFT